MESGGDEWLAADKVEHAVACFAIALVASALAARSRRPILRRRSAALGSAAAFLAGSAKEAADALGLWGSAGASAKDAAADLLGLALARLALAASRSIPSSSERKRGVSTSSSSSGDEREQGVSMV
ncbi:uncharacterized protein LOC109711888 [Ananas comosus]|uniref:Uncharacterized protein LOC109711888 n=1 Tax=Ananas comosus TaxID=4615 RepID=A0A6P5F4C6_ANACO|nr:uncharacterized protein LOC109711888 [Ananas comosus]